MSLYPTTVDPTPTLDEFYELPSGSLHAFSFDIEPGEAKEILVVHLLGVGQDHSLRCWVSLAPANSPAVEQPYYVIWHANRNESEIRTICAEGTDFPDAKMPIYLPPGSYFVNVLNLVNKVNAYAYSLTTV